MNHIVLQSGVRIGCQQWVWLFLPITRFYIQRATWSIWNELSTLFFAVYSVMILFYMWASLGIVN